jgi:hypothetical protein
MSFSGLTSDEYLAIAENELRRQRAAVALARKALQQARDDGWSGANQAIADMNIALYGEPKSHGIQTVVTWLRNTLAKNKSS